MTAPANYSRLQISLHWVITALVAFQILFHQSIETAWRARMSGAVPNTPSPNLHVAAGLLIFALVLWRLWLRLRRGVPAAPQGEHPALALIARTTHTLFYVLLVLLPVSGAAAWFIGVPQPAITHVLAKNVLLALIGLHIAAALAQHFWFRSNALRRMLGMG